jgi:hypothetical protein
MVYILKNYLKNKQIEKVLQQNYDVFLRFKSQGVQTPENTVTYIDKETGLTILQRVDTGDMPNIQDIIRRDSSVVFTVGLKDGERKDR